MKKQDIKEKERQHAAAYARIPSEAAEFEEWEPEQVWPEDQEGEPEKAIQQTAAVVGRTKAMEEALEKAAEIRHQLEGRHHSDSTELVAEDRRRVGDSTNVGTFCDSDEKNCHSVDTGPAVRDEDPRL